MSESYDVYFSRLQPEKLKVLLGQSAKALIDRGAPTNLIKMSLLKDPICPRNNTQKSIIGLDKSKLVLLVLLMYIFLVMYGETLNVTVTVLPMIQLILSLF